MVWIFLIPLGVSYGSAWLIGNNLGANKPKSARTYAHAVLLFGTLLNVIVFTPILIWRENIVGIYTSDEDINNYSYLYCVGSNN